MAYDDYTPTQREEADIARDEGLEEWGMDTTAGDIENIPHPPGMNPHRAYAYWAATNPVEAAMRPDLLPSVDAMRLVRAAREGDPEAQRKVDTVNALARSGMRASPVAAKARDNLMRAAALDDIERQTGRPFGGGEDVSGDMYLQGCAGDSEGVGSLWGKLRNIGRIIDPTRKESVFRSAIQAIPIVGPSAVSAIDTTKNAADTVKAFLPSGGGGLFGGGGPAVTAPYVPGAPGPGPYAPSVVAPAPGAPVMVRPAAKPGGFALTRWYDLGTRAGVPGFVN